MPGLEDSSVVSFFPSSLFRFPLCQSSHHCVDQVEKYKLAARTANTVMASLIAQVKVGAKIVDLCEFGDAQIVAEAAKHYGKKKKMLKGIAFPTCISVNDVMGHFSPSDKEDKAQLAAGDVVKIDFAVHFDGYVSTMAHTTVATEKPTEPIDGATADVICAAYFAGEAAVRLLKKGGTNAEVTDMLGKVAKDFGVNPLSNSFSHQLTRFQLDADEAIAGREDPDQKVELLKFEDYQVWSLDIMMSTGEGKPKQSGHKSTIYKRTDDKYHLKQQGSKDLNSWAKTHSETLAWSLRAMKDKDAVGIKGLLGIKEMSAHNCLFEYPVMIERSKKAVIAQFKYTVLILPTKTEKLNSAPLPYVSSQKKVEDAGVAEILKRGLVRKKEKSAAPALVPAADEEAKK